MAIDVRDLATRQLEPIIAEELDIFERTVAEYLDGRVDEDTFRVFRLNHGVYGQRQGGRAQMLRIKIPHGRINAEHLDTFAYIADNYSRGWGHLTTRQNVQFHFIPLEQSPEILRLMASVGLTSREACGDTVRNVMGCHLAGACPQEVLDITPWAKATTEFLLRHPYGQRLPRKFKINFSGCATDCGQAMFNDVGVVATSRTLADGTTEAGFRVFIAGGLGANPHPAQALEEFTSREELLPTIYSCLRTFDHYGNRDNKIRARMKWLVDSMGIDELRERIFRERKFLRGARDWPWGIPQAVLEAGDAPAGGTPEATKVGPAFVPVKLLSSDPFDRWQEANVVRGRANGTISAVAYSRLGDITSDQFRALADIQRDFALDIRITNRQNLALRDLNEADVHALYERLNDIGMAEAGAELARDVVSCPGADTCNLAVTQSRGLAAAIGDALEEEGLAEVPGVRVNISGCTNSCGQHHISDIGFFGLERRAHGRAAPGYQMLLGGYLGETEVEFGEKATKVPAKNAPQAVVRVVRRFNEERQPGEMFQAWLARSGGAKGVGDTLTELDEFPTPDVGPEFYVDYDETGPYVAEVGDGGVRGHVSLLDPVIVDRPLVDIDLAELAAVSAELENKPASKAIKWAWERFGSDIVLAASFQDCVLVDVAAKVAPGIEVVFLDTQYHFAETIWYVDRVRERYDLNLTVMQPLVSPDDLWQTDQDECCAMRKVEPLARALRGKQAWMTGLRRAESPTRTNAPIAHLDVGRGIVKVNPLATWSDADIAAYKQDHDLLEHPLASQGYPSIGCWPCTRPVAPGEDPRSGRWSGQGKMECGLHGWPEA